MWHSKLSRRRFLALSGATLASALLGDALGQAASGGSTASKTLRIGAVIPTTGNTATLGTFQTEALMGSAADNGALMAADQFYSSSAVGEGWITSAVGAKGVTRAAERLASEDAYAIIGGFSTEEALALSDLALKRDFIFLNIGAQDDSLRGQSCNSHTFHLAASTTMYLDALTGWGIHSGFQRWYFVYDDSDVQKANYATAGKILKSRSGSEVGSTMVKAGTPLYTGVFEDIKKASPDLVVLLLEPSEQLVFWGQYETSGLDIETIGYPYPAAQTRQFYAASLQNAPKTGAKQHMALWEATLDKGRAVELNLSYLGRFGQAMDPSAWAAYMGIKIMADATMNADSTKTANLIKYLENPQTAFDIYKGPNTSFRPWNHQMRQPLYLVKANASYQDKHSLQDVASLEGELPALYAPDVPPVRRLEQLGVSEQDSKCNLNPAGK
jgi:ABC-type branched-subunit amino acid transport system substrate-binding protein